MVHWYIQESSESSNLGSLQSIIYMIQEMGMVVHSEKYVPFGGMDYSFLPVDEPVVALTGISAVQDHQKRGLPHKPFAWFDQKTLCCAHYYAYYGEYLLQKRYGLYPLAEIIRQEDWLYKTFANERDQVFIKPDTNDKSFTGGVVKRELFGSWAKSSNRYGLVDPTQLCVVSTPVDIKQEWRLFVADGKVVAGSLYSHNGMLCQEPYYPEEVKNFAEQMAKIWSPHPIFVMDIAETSEGLKLCEVGSANCAGFYHSEIRPIIKAMAEIAIRGE
jgi:hypothetical protein